MKRALSRCFPAVAFFLMMVPPMRAEVKTEEKSLVKFEGMMGRMMGMFAGKAAKEGILNTNAVKGNRKITINDTSGSIIDLDEQKIYELDMKKKSYEVVTFEQMRNRLKEAQEKASKMAKDESGKEQPAGKQMEVEFSVKESGEKKEINGYGCREVVMIISTHEKGKTIEQAGGMVMTSHLWLAPAMPAIKEIQEFDKRYWEALQGPLGFGDMQQMAMMAAMYPGMKEIMSKMQSENVNMDGTPILTEMAAETVQGTEQAASKEQKEEGAGKNESSGGIASIRGIGGMLGRKMARKKEDEPAGEKPKGRSQIFTTTHELIKVSTSVAASDLAIPAGFKEKK